MEWGASTRSRPAIFAQARRCAGGATAGAWQAILGGAEEIALQIFDPPGVSRAVGFLVLGTHSATVSILRCRPAAAASGRRSGHLPSGEILDEGAVDLQDIDWQQPHVADEVWPAPKSFDRNPGATILDAFDELAGAVDILDQRCLGDLDDHRWATERSTAICARKAASQS